MSRIIVLQGGAGIGRAAARSFALSGDEVVIIGRRQGVLAATAAGLNTEVGTASIDLASRDSRR